MSYSASCCSDFLLQQKYDSHSLIKSPLICWRVVLALSFCPLNFTLPANKTSKLTVNLSVCLFPLELHKDVDLSHKSAETLRVFRFSLMLWCENIVCIYALVWLNETILLQFSSPQTRLEISWRLSLKISSCFTPTNTEVQSWTHWLGSILTVTPPSSPPAPTVKVGSQTFCRNDSMVHRIWTNVNVSLVCVNVNMLSWRRGWWEIYSSRLNDVWSSTMFW